MKSCKKVLKYFGGILFPLIVLIFMVAGPSMAGTTGKIFGKIVDKTTGEPLISASVIVNSSNRGAATDLDGEYYILNISPGIYSVTASMVGYQPVTYTGVSISIDKTTTLDFSLDMMVLEAAEAVVFVVERPMVKRDLTSSESLVSSEQLDMMPVENFGEAVQLQAGVVNGHFRGGRSSEVSYMIDGVVVSDPYANSDPFGRNTSNQVETGAIQEIQVISGTFNAEYGQAMSGIVNVVTKDGDREKIEGHVSMGIGDYVSSQSLGLNSGFDPIPDRSNYMDDLNLSHLQDYQLNLSGPVPYSNSVTFFTTARFLSDNGRLYGQRIFTPSDSNNFSDPTFSLDNVMRSGDGEVVSLDPFEKWSFQVKLTKHFESGGKLSYSILRDAMEFQNLDENRAHQDETIRGFKYNPDGNYQKFKTGQNHILSWTHALSNKTFYNINASYTSNTEKQYVHEDPFSSEYVDPRRLQDAQNHAFYTGGQAMWNVDRETRIAGLKFDITHQLDKKNQLKLGVDVTQYLLRLNEFQLLWDDIEQEVYINPPGSWNNQEYPDRDAESLLGGFPFSGPGHRPMQSSFYMQDKMEYESMIVNLGVRFDYFHPDGVIPNDLRDPASTRSEDNYREAEAHTQFSPRIGLAFPLTEAGVVHFSYGHFFQTPPFQYLYYNPNFFVRGGPLQTLIGNAELKPEKTIMYEVGLQQEIAPGVGLDITGFYKDIRNLLGTEIQNTYEQDRYARYVNRDYGNVRGITIALDRRQDNLFGLSMDYTFQVAEGNSSTPDKIFEDSQLDPPRETEKRVVPLDWDQSHTFNASLTLGEPSTWSVGVIGTLGSGLPYTSNPYLKPKEDTNGESKPMQYKVDLKAYRVINVSDMKFTLTLWVYNLFDRKNENDVWSDTGRATYTLENTQSVTVKGYNTLDDYLNHPEWFAAPRQVKLSLSFGF